MRRGRGARAALLAYPPDVRERLGAEITATLLDVSQGSRHRYARELAGLTRAGMRERGRRAAADGARRVLADGVCLAAVWLMALDLSTLLGQIVRGMHDPLLARGPLVLLGVALAFALVGLDRPAGALALLWTAVRLPALAADMAGPPTAGSALVVLAVTFVPVVCFATLLLAPRRQRLDPRGLVWFTVPAGLAVTLGPPPWEQSPLLLGIVWLVALLVVLSALVQLASDPRLAIAAAIPLSTLGIRPDRVGLPVVVATVVLALAAARLWRLRRVPI